MGLLLFRVLLVMATLVQIVNGMEYDFEDPMELGRTGNLLVLLYLLRRRRRLQRPTRRYWVCPTNSRRQQQGAWDNFVLEVAQEEPDKFENFHRLTVEQFNILLDRIAPLVQRSAVVREPIPAGLKLSLTLRYLAGGETMVSIAYFYRVGKSTASLIIAETCEAIRKILQPEVLLPPTAQRWEEIAEDFYRIWNFPNCVGAIDGKHVAVQSFANSGSEFYNYKGSFSTSLLACCDAHYRFTFVSIGSRGRESDGGIFNATDFGQSILRERLDLPQPRIFDGFPTPLPPVFLGDQAFPLLPQLMRPFPLASNAEPARIIYNYRHSRGRRVIENAFGILASRFRIFRRPIHAKVETVDRIVQAAIVLHNWLRTIDIATKNHRYIPTGFVDWEDGDGTVHEGQWRQDTTTTGLIQIPRTATRNATQRAKTIRDNQALYFISSGQVPWQWQHLPNFVRPHS